MSPVTHLLLGWNVATAARLEKRERLLVTVAGIIPDVDGLGVIPEFLTRNTSYPLMWWSDYHHVFGHNALYAFLCAMLAALLSRHRLQAAGVVLLSIHLHLFCDVVGGRGPDGYVWTVPYFWPFLSGQEWIWSWQGQWKLNSWQNLILTAFLLFTTFRTAWLRGYSPLEFISARANDVFVETLRFRIPLKQ